jgi:hypothetical protein
MTKWHNDKNGKLAKQQVDKMACRQNGIMTKWQNEKWHYDKMVS